MPLSAPFKYALYPLRVESGANRYNMNADDVALIVSAQSGPGGTTIMHLWSKSFGRPNPTFFWKWAPIRWSILLCQDLYTCLKFYCREFANDLCYWSAAISDSGKMKKFDGNESCRIICHDVKYWFLSIWRLVFPRLAREWGNNNPKRATVESLRHFCSFRRWSRGTIRDLFRRYRDLFVPDVCAG